MSKDHKHPVLGLAKAMVFAVKQFRLYSANHPITQQSLSALGDEISKYFASASKVNLGTMRKLLVVNGEIIGEKESTVNELAKEFDRLGLEGITLEKAWTQARCRFFFRSWRPPQKPWNKKAACAKFTRPTLCPI